MSRPSGGNARSTLGSRSSGGLRSSSGNKPSLRSGGLSQATPGRRGQQIHHAPVGMWGNSNPIRPHPSKPAAKPVQRPSVGQRPSPGQRPISPGLNTGTGQLPNQRPQPPANLTNRTNRSRNINQINAPRSVNVEGYDGGWGYQGEDYPWGLGAVAGAAGFTLGSVLNALPSNSQPVVIQGQPYYESNGMYLAPAEGGNYTVVPPPPGVVETQFPTGAKPVDVAGQTLYEVQGVYYQPTIQNGKEVYTVVVP